MLAKIVEGIPDALKQVAGQGALAEYKYDGVRAQIHLLPDRSVKIFSRNSEVTLSRLKPSILLPSQPLVSFQKPLSHPETLVSS